MLAGRESQLRETGRCEVVGLRGGEAEGAATSVDRVGMADEDLVDKCPGRCGRPGAGGRLE